MRARIHPPTPTHPPTHPPTHRESYGFRPHKGATGAATVLTLLLELAQVLDAPLVGAGTDYTKCIDLMPQAISMALLEIHGTGAGPGRDPTPKGGGGGGTPPPLYGPQNCRTEQCALSAPEAPHILF